MHTTRLPKLRSRRSTQQLEKRRERIKQRSFEAKLLEGVPKERTGILWPWQQWNKERLKRGPGSAGGRTR